MSNEATVKQFRTADGKKVVSIVGGRGLFRFVEEGEQYMPPVDGLDGYCYWSEIYRSGVYPSPVDAEAAAMEEVPWLRSDH